MKPKKFWDELSTKLITLPSFEDRILVIKCMILLYKSNYKIIKKVNFLQLLIKMLNIENGAHTIDYYLIQLIYTLIQNDPLKYNLRKFMESNGLTFIIKMIKCNLFDDNISEKGYQEMISELRESNKKLNQGINYMYANVRFDREALDDKFQKANLIVLCM